MWYKRFNSFMTTHDFKRSSYDSCVYFKKSNDGSFVYLLLYVDDMLITNKDKEDIRKVKVKLNKEFEMKDFHLLYLHKHMMMLIICHEFHILM